MRKGMECYEIWNDKADHRWVGKNCMVHTPVIFEKSKVHWANKMSEWQTRGREFNGDGYTNATYTFFIERDGTIYYSPLTSKNQIHCYGQNQISLGIAINGDGDKQFGTKEQMESLKKILITHNITGILYHKDYPQIKNGVLIQKTCPGEKLAKTLENYDDYITSLIVKKYYD